MKSEARIGDKSYGCGEGHTKKAAEQEAAYHGHSGTEKEGQVKVINGGMYVS